MVGIIIQLAISWLVLWFIYKKDLSVLGIKPTASRLTYMVTGLLLAAACCAIYQLLTTAFIDNNWILNRKISTTQLFQRSGKTLVSVVYEELIFRGALLYIGIKKLGVTKACIISAVAFGVYHWFTFNVLGNPFMMGITFLMTAIVGLSWAFAFAKTNSLYLPVGLHAGWNLIASVVFTSGSMEQALLYRSNEQHLQGMLSLVVFLFQVFALPLVTFWYLNRISTQQSPVNQQQQALSA